MAQSSTEQLKSLIKKVALEADGFMRQELRGSHQGQGHSDPTNRPDTLTQSICCQLKSQLA